MNSELRRFPVRRHLGVGGALALIAILAAGAIPLFGPFDSASTLSAQSLAQVRQTDWNTLRPIPMVTLEIRKLVGMLMLVPAVTLFLLYVFRPRPYVLAGVTAWAAGSVMMLVLSFDSAPHPADGPDRLSVGRLALAAWALGALVFGAGLRCAGVWFRAPSHFSRGIRWSFTIAVVWTAAAATFLSPSAVVGPAFIMMCVWQTRGAIALVAAARRERMVGAALTSAGILGMVMVNTIALSVATATGGIGAASTRVAYFNFFSAALLVLGMHLLIFEDVIEELRTSAAALAASRDDMKAMAVTDLLTQCYNRRFLSDIAEHELEQHRRYKLPLSLLYIDIDHFKAINDTLGHQTGDDVLQTIGAILCEQTRQADYVFRWGGDEFLLLLSTTEAEARAKAEDIRQRFLKSEIVSRLPDGVDLSIGIVGVPPETKEFGPLIDQADREMYRRKRALAS
jgi:diguanylate cyclase (GGDEF)-like protein